MTINSYFGDIWKYIWYSIYFKILPPVSFVIYVGGVDCGIESGDWPRAHPLFILPRTYRSTQPLFSLSPRAQCHKSHSLKSFLCNDNNFQRLNLRQLSMLHYIVLAMQCTHFSTNICTTERPQMYLLRP